MAAFRRQNLGFVFQDFNLLDTLTLKDNIFLPLVLSGKKYTEMESRIAPIAEQLGISKLLNKYPYEVSGGQKQRAAVARALITQPCIDGHFNGDDVLYDGKSGGKFANEPGSITDHFKSECSCN